MPLLLRQLCALLLGCTLLALPGRLAMAQAPGSRGVEIPEAHEQAIDWYDGSHALLIGVSDYTDGWSDLETVPHELDEVAAALQTHGFEVERLIDPGAAELKEAIGDFLITHGFGERSAGNRLLVFYSGHGYSRTVGGQVKGYLVPADAPLPRLGGRENKEFLRKALRMSQILEWARELEARHALFLFDSCFSGTIFKSRALPAVPGRISALTAKPVRQFISAGSAFEEVPAESVFARALVRGLQGDADLTDDGYVLGSELGIYLREELLRYQTGQTTQFGKIRDPRLDQGDFVFRLAGSEAGSADPTPTSTAANPSPGRSVSSPGEGSGPPPTKPPWPRGSLEDRERRNPVDGLYYVWIPEGRFVPGCSPGDDACEDDERSPDPREVESGGFWLGRTEVTVRAYLKLAHDPSLLPPPPSFNPGWRDESQPVVNLSRAEASRFCRWAATRLPTEVEWEYAARGANKRASPSDLEPVAWFAGNSDERAHSVGQKQPNAFGLYDVLGNAAEWVRGNPGQAESAGVLRGGSWLHAPRYLRYSLRLLDGPERREPMYGFRCLASAGR